MRHNTCKWQINTPWAPEIEALGLACQDWYSEAHLCDGADAMRLLSYAASDDGPVLESLRVYAGPYTLAALYAWGAYCGSRAVQMTGLGRDDILAMCREFLASLYCPAAKSQRIAYGLGRTIYVYRANARVAWYSSNDPFRVQRNRRPGDRLSFAPSFCAPGRA